MIAVLWLALAAATARAGEPACVAERKPNDTAEHATPVTGAFCVEGDLDGGHPAAFLWTVPADLQLTPWTIALEGPFMQSTKLALLRADRGAAGEPVFGPERWSASTPPGSATLRADRLLLRAGSYFVVVQSSGVGPYRLGLSAGPAPARRESEPNDEPERATPLAPREVTAGDRANSDDYFHFTVRAADARRTFALAFEATLEESLGIEVRSASGDVLLAHSDRVTGPLDVGDLALEPGDYVVRVHSTATAPSPYRITLVPGLPRSPSREAEPNNSRDRAAPLALGRTIAGKIGWSDDTDVYAIEPDPRLVGKLVELRLDAGGARTRRICLVDESSDQLQCRQGTALRLPALGLGTARYAVVVSGEADPRQTYSLTLRLAGLQQPDAELEPNDVARGATAIETRHTVRGRLEGDDVDFFRMSVTGAPELWTVAVRGSGVASVALERVQGDVVGSGSAVAGSDTVRTAEAMLLGGDYWIEVRGADADYELEAKAIGKPDPGAEREPNDTDAKAHLLRFGVARTGTIEDRRDVDKYRFSLAGPDHVALEVVPPPDGSVNAVVEWGYPSRKAPGTTVEMTPVVYDAMLEPGDYVVTLTTDHPTRGRYRITLEHRSPFEAPDDREPNDTPAQASPFPASHVVEGNVGDFGDADWFDLPADARAIRVAVTGEVTPEIQVGGKESPSEWDETRYVLGAKWPSEGTARLGVRGRGKYSLRATFPGGPAARPKPPALPVRVKLDLGSRPIAAFWVRGQRVRGFVDLTNEGRAALDLALDASSSHFAYRPELGATRVRLAAGARERVPIEVAVGPDAWSDRDIHIGVRATAADGASRAAIAEVVADPTAAPIGDEVAFPVPAALLGGFDVASSALGGLVVGAGDDRSAEQQALLHDGLISSGGYRVAADTLPVTIGVRFAVDRTWPIAGVAIHPQMAGALFPAEQLRDFELRLSPDGKTFETVLRARLSMLPIEQSFVLERTVAAAGAELRLLSNHADNIGWVGLSEWKVIAVPGEPSGLSANLLDPRRGGHVVRSEPLIGQRTVETRGVLGEGRNAVLADIRAGTRPEWIVAFHEDRAAEIVSFEWREADDTTVKNRFGAVTLAVSLSSPLGPWKELGTWKLEKNARGVATFALPKPEWARFVRFASAAPIPKDGRWAFPKSMRIFERPTDDEYRSILGEWGFSRAPAIFERTRGIVAPAAAPATGAGGRTREAAVPLELDRPVASEVRLGSIEDWYRVVIPSGRDTLALTVENDPTVDVAISLADSAGAVRPLRVASSSAETLVLEATVDPGATLHVRVEEPPWAVGIAYDTSLSLANFRDNVSQAVMAYAEGVTPGREFVNLMNFSGPFMLPEWTDQWWLVQGAFASVAKETESSALEETMVSLLDGLGSRRGSRAAIITTDAASGASYSASAALWRALARVRPHVFPAHIGAGDDPLSEKQILQDLATAHGGYYASARTQAEMDVVAARAAAWMRRPARYRLTASASNAPAPRPGSISVARGSAPPASATRSATAATPGAAAGVKAAAAVELILDASGSMLQRFEGKKRIDVARAVLTQLVTRTLPKDTAIALRVFGDDAPGSCATRLAAPLAPVDPKPLAGFIAAVRPKNGAKTPIAASLAQVASDLESASGARTVVLVTDGEETCGGDPQAEIEALMAKGFDVRVNIVGFAVDDAKLKDTFREWAAAGGGQYFDAQSSKELGRALEAAVSEPFRALDAAGAVIATGIVSGPDVSVPAGVYRIEVGTTSPKVFADVVVDADQVTRLDVTP